MQQTQTEITHFCLLINNQENMFRKSLGTGEMSQVEKKRFNKFIRLKMTRQNNWI